MRDKGAHDNKLPYLRTCRRRLQSPIIRVINPQSATGVASYKGVDAALAGTGELDARAVQGATIASSFCHSKGLDR